MLSSRWYKIFNDLRSNKTRTILIVLSIAVGLFAVGAIVSSRTILSTEMDQSFTAINPSSGTIRTQELFDEDFVRSVRAMPDVAEADARRSIYTRVQVDSGEWYNITLFSVADYDDMRVNKIWPERGAWPPSEGEILIERAALPVIKAQVGDRVLLETSNEKLRRLRIAGTAHDMAQLPAQIDGTPYGYVSLKTLEQLGEDYGFNELHIVVKNGDDKEFAQGVVNQVKNKAEKNDLTIPMSLTAEPGQIPLDDILQAILFLMATLGLLSLFLSVFLIINTVSAMLAQQKRQIGVMKALGASTVQIMGMYLAMVLFYGVMALIISLPLSIAGSRGLSRFLAAMFNFDLLALNIPPQAILLQIVVGLLVPVLASLYPFLANLRITAAEAMHSYQLGKGRFGNNPLDRLLSGANLWFARRVLLRPWLLSLRNTFRNKGRLALTLITLILAGAIFVSVFSVRASLFQTIDDLLQLFNFDTMLMFRQPYRVEEIRQEAQYIPGVAQTDVWIQISARRVRPDGSESQTFYMFAPRADSELAPGPVIIQGRWLLPEDDNAVIIDTIMLKEEPDLKLGDDIVLKIEGKEIPFRIVGVSLGYFVPFIYGHYPYIARITGRVGEADAVLVTMEGHEQVSEVETATALEARFDRVGLRVSLSGGLAQERSEAEATFGSIISLLLIMAILLAIVGGLGLMGTMSINVLERTREIGVLRAIGAPNRGVARVFIREGIAIGLLSWLLGSLFALPLSKLLSDGLGKLIANAPLTFVYSLTGVWLWLVLVVILSALASALPARNASRLTVREVLAYE